MKEMHFVCNLDAAQFTDETIIMYLRKEAVNESHTLMQTASRTANTRVDTAQRADSIESRKTLSAED